MPFGTTPYASLAQLKAYLPDMDASNDAVLNDILARASQIIDDEASGRFFDKQSAGVRTFDGSGFPKLFVYPTLAATPSLVRVRDGALVAYRTVAAADYVVQPTSRPPGWPGLYLELLDAITGSDRVWPRWRQSVEVTADWGWAAVPRDIEEATLELAVNLFRSRGSSPDFVGIPGLQEGALPRAIPALAERILRYGEAVFA